MRYFFHCAEAPHHFDNEGMELESLDAARYQASRWLAELLTELPDVFWSSGRLAIFVTDADWKLIFSLTTMGAEVPGEAEAIERRWRLHASEPTR